MSKNDYTLAEANNKYFLFNNSINHYIHIMH